MRTLDNHRARRNPLGRHLLSSVLNRPYKMPQKAWRWDTVQLQQRGTNSGIAILWVSRLDFGRRSIDGTDEFFSAGKPPLF